MRTLPLPRLLDIGLEFINDGDILFPLETIPYGFTDSVDFKNAIGSKIDQVVPEILKVGTDKCRFLRFDSTVRSEQPKISHWVAPSWVALARKPALVFAI